MPYRSQLTTSRYPKTGRHRSFYGYHGTVTLEFDGDWHVDTTHEGKEDHYMTDSREAAVNYYAKQVTRVR